ncbi:uncharacterized protein BX663DRAFT_495598 [Cokeromyces recurvatus]|uniref:uncharacterized protein n=1 Tax=Cokeromyces recurvatus TaxID=90255 RepID=UPI00222027D8|nr:uncharacterized protein BX663DRAFT_495598 [Cokeromyces recurvatus]KAI7907342.1 hypothetical protein BX663DRAFT_495598 [Cokeromyces recurvatus]
MIFNIKLSSLFNNNKLSEDSLSTSSTITPSKSRSSAIHSFLAAFSTEKYMNDPMRTTNHPDIVGYYYDPMSCDGHRNHVSVGYDVTNTGA